MPFHSMNFNNINNKKYNGYVPLQVQRLNNKHTKNNQYHFVGERAYFFTSKSLNGGITLEAAITLPIFLIILLAFLQCFLLFYTNLRIQKSMDSLALKLGKTEYILERLKEISGDALKELDDEDKKEIVQIGENIVTTAYVKSKLIKDVGEEFITSSFIHKGVSGLNFSSTGIKENRLNIAVSYQYQIPFLPEKLNKIKVKQNSNVFIWCGKSLKEDKYGKIIVYITPTGVVYHTNKNCSHIKLNIITIWKHELDSKRNSYGAKYSKCNSCCKDIYLGEILYITSEGTSYHYSNSCSRLKRGVMEVDLQTVKNLKQCSRCGLNGN